MTVNKIKQRSHPWLGWLGGLSLIAFPTLALPALSAERIYVNYSVIERSVPIEALEIYAKEGKITDDLRAYTRYLSPAQRQQFRQGLQTRIDLDPVTVSQFLYTPIGERLLQRISQVIQTPSRRPAFLALRASLILAAASPEGLTPLNILQRFPLQGVRVDVARGLNILSSIERLVQQTAAAVQATQMDYTEAEFEEALQAFSRGRDLRFRGPFAWQKVTFNLTDSSRADLGLGRGPRQFPVDVYLPDLAQTQPQPVIVISHGLGSDRQTFAYLAEQLASYGFVVAVPEHPGSSSQQLIALVTGQAREVAEPAEFIDRPLDITFLLNELAQRSQSDPQFQGRLNLEQVGVIGQSFGGYTALALAGAPLNFEKLQQECGERLEQTLDVSLVLQCQALVLPRQDYNLSDDRVKAVIAINPITSAVFGQESLSQIQVPTMIVGGTADTIAPALLEQIRPFTWLTTPDKYLVVMEGGTHLSVTGESASSDLVAAPAALEGPAPIVARSYVEALSVAFFETYVANQPTYARYLTPAYTTVISRPPLELSISQTLSVDDLR